MATARSDSPSPPARTTEHLLEGARRLLPPAVGVVALAVLARVAYGPGFVTNDPVWSLAWGEQIAHGMSPAVTDPGASTSHPLPNIVAAALSVLGSAAEPALHASGYLAVGFVGDAVFRLTRRLAGTVAAVVAVALALSRPTIASFGTLAVIDVPFCALVLYAIVAAARSPRAATPVLGLLAIAGLARPEAWLLSGLYWLWLWRDGGLRAARRPLPLVAAAPLTWIAVDWALTGDALFSLHATRDATELYGRVTGIHGLLTEGVHVLGYELRPTVLVAAALGFAVLWFVDRQHWPLWVTVAAAVSMAIPVAAGTPLNGRYLIVVVVLCCVAAAAAITLPLRRRGTAALVLAAGSAVAVLAGVPDVVDRVDGTRTELADQARSHDDARRLVEQGIPCRPLSVTGLLLRPAVAVWTDVDLDDITEPKRGVPDHGTFLIGTATAASSFTAVDASTATPPVRAPSGARAVARRGGWTLLSACG